MFNPRCFSLGDQRQPIAFADRLSHILSPAANRVRSWSVPKGKKKLCEFYEETASRRHNRSKYKEASLNIFTSEQPPSAKTELFCERERNRISGPLSVALLDLVATSWRARRLSSVRRAGVFELIVAFSSPSALFVVVMSLRGCQSFVHNKAPPADLYP